MVMCRCRSAPISRDVGRAATPPGPPLKLTRFCRSGVDDGRVVSVAHDCDVYVGHRAVVVVGAVSPVAAEEADHLSAGRIFVPRSNLYRIAKLPGASGVDASAA